MPCKIVFIWANIWEPKQNYCEISGRDKCNNLEMASTSSISTVTDIWPVTYTDEKTSLHGNCEVEIDLISAVLAALSSTYFI